MNKASQGSALSRRFSTASRHSQTFDIRGEPKRDPTEDAALLRPARRSGRRRRRSGTAASAPAQARIAGSAPPMRSRRRPIPPAIGEANAWLMTIRRAPSACSREKTAPFGSRPIDSPLGLTIRSRPKSSTCGVVRTSVGDPDMASFVHPSAFAFALSKRRRGEA